MSYSTTQMLKDMRDPRYARDPEFRAEVERKMSGEVTHGGRVTTNSGVVAFGKGESNVGGISVKIGSEHRESGGVTRSTIDPTAIYTGAGYLQSAEQVREAFSDPRYQRDPAFRAEVAAAIELMGPASDFKI